MSASYEEVLVAFRRIVSGWRGPEPIPAVREPLTHTHTHTQPGYLKPFWRYYGGKWRAAPRYPKPEYGTIVEPFAGAAGYSMRHYRSDVVLVEKYHVIAEIWRYLISAKEEQVMDIPLVEHVDHLPPWVPQGGRWLVGFAMNAATTQPCKQLSSGRKELRSKGRVFEGWSEQMRARCASQVRHVRHWRVIEGDYYAAPDVEATWFIDPPYQQAGRYYKHSSADIDYRGLAEWCRSRRGQVMVCENEGAEWLPFKTFASIKSNQMSGRGGKSHEVLWTSDGS